MTADCRRVLSCFSCCGAQAHGADEPQFSHFLARYSYQVVVGYILIGASIFLALEHHGDNTKLTFLEAVYLATVTITTVGYGDVTPITTGGKLFCLVYTVGGLTLVSTSVGILAHDLLAKAEDARDAAGAAASAAGEAAAAVATAAAAAAGADGVAAILEGGGAGESGAAFNQAPAEPDYYSPEGRRARRKKFMLRFLRPSCTIAALATIGTVFMYARVGTSFVDSLYWAVISLTSVGFGDIHPPAGADPALMDDAAYRLFAVLYLLVGVAVTGSSLGEVVSVWMEIEDERHVADFLRRGVSVATIEAIDVDGDGEVDRAEFLAYMLVKMGKCQRGDVEMMNALFDKLDADSSGTLDLADLRHTQEHQAEGGGSRPGHRCTRNGKSEESLDSFNAAAGGGTKLAEAASRLGYKCATPGSSSNNSAA